MKPRIGPIMQKCLDFANRCSDNGGWHTFDQRPGTRKPIERLAKIGLVEINQFEMFRITREGIQ